MHTGIIGGRLGTAILRRIGGRAVRGEICSGRAYEGKSKLEVLFGPGVWEWVRGRTVIDFGCGGGRDAIEMATRGARRVIGLDLQTPWLEQGRRAAAEAGVGDICEFVTHTDVKADTIFSLDGFEHYDDPHAVLAWMRSHVADDGRVHIAFGPPWCHPLGGHLFSVFPWAHLLFTERALLTWRAGFKNDGATRFHEVTGGLNQMTIGRFERAVHESAFDVESLDCHPIRGLRPLGSRVTREFFTAMVRCRLAPRVTAQRSSTPGDPSCAA